MSRFVPYLSEEAIERDSAALFSEYEQARGIVITHSVPIEDIIENQHANDGGESGAAERPLRHPWRRGPSADQVGRPYLFSAAAVFALLAFQGWFGGQLVYGLGAGVSAAGQGVVSPEEGQMSLAPLAAFTQPVHDHHEHVY